MDACFLKGEMMGKTRKIVLISLTAVFATLLAVLLGLYGFWTNAFGAERAVLTTEQMTIPYWFNQNGDETIIYNEIVTPIRYGSSDTAVGYLTYTPSEIISVQNYSQETTYSSSSYTISGNQISFPISSGIAYMQEEWLDGKNIPSEYQDGSLINAAYNDGGGTNRGSHVVAENALTRTNYIVVTYKYNHAQQGLGFQTPSYVPENYPNLLKKLNAGEPIKILIFGDSISVGASASAFSNFPPYTPTYFDQIKNFLAARYYAGDTSKITLVNTSRGGEASAWGVKQVRQSAFDKSNYDLIVVGFGMNDGSLSVNPKVFKSNIAQIVSSLRETSPEADFVLLGTFTPNPKSVFAGNHSQYMQELSDLAESLNIISTSHKSGCTFVNLWDISTGILTKKQANNSVGNTRYQYMDISANYTNHPNDFMVRLYAGAILSTFIDFNI